MIPLARAARSDFAHFDPGALIAAVNALWALGKEGALDAVEQQLAAADRSKDPLNGLFLVLRLLFEVPADPGFQPRMLLGAPSLPAPPDPKALPYFPLLVVEDIPLLLVTSYALGGLPEPVESHVRHFRDKGTLRRAPLAPRTDLGHAEILERARRLYRAAYGADPKPAVSSMLRQQLERMA